MINSAFPVLNLVDGWLAVWVPDLARICIWGAVFGAGTLVIYFVLSDQTAIAELKRETRELRRRTLDPNLEKSEVLRLGWRNLAISFRLLAKTGVPSLLSALPVVVIVCWLSAYQGYGLNADNVPVELEILPTDQGVTFFPSEAFIRKSEYNGFIAGDKCVQVRLFCDGRLVYDGTPSCPPSGRVRKKVWWNLLVGSEVGYIDSRSTLEELQFRFPRKMFLHGVPIWMGTWELPFFLSLAAVALAIKMAFRVE
jgi:hypothetical protein